MSNRIKYKTGVILVLFAGLFWSLFGIIIRQISTANTWQILFYRCISLFLLISLILLFRYKSEFRTVIFRSLRSDILGGIGLLFALVGSVISILNTTVANTLFLLAITPLFTAFLARFFLKEKIKPHTWIAISAAILGSIIIVFDEVNLQKSLASFFAIISAFGFSYFTIMLRVGKQNDSLPSVWYGAAFTVIISAMVCVFFRYGIVISFWDIGVSVMLGLFQIGIGLVCYTIGAIVVPAAQLGLLIMTEVILGPIWVWIFLGEGFRFGTLVGGLLVLCAVTFDIVFSFGMFNRKILKV